MPANPRSNPAGTPEVRVVAVLDANVLIPPGLRDMVLSCAFAGAFRPVWQAEIEDEVYRNSIRIAVERRGQVEEKAIGGAEHTLEQMRRAFPDACAATTLWVPLVPQMTCDDKDRHVLAVAVGTGATHLITANTRDFPVRSRPQGVAVVTPDRFLRDQLARVPDLVLEAVEGMSRRLMSPPQCPVEIAQLFRRRECPEVRDRTPRPPRQLDRTAAREVTGARRTPWASHCAYRRDQGVDDFHVGAGIGLFLSDLRATVLSVVPRTTIASLDTLDSRSRGVSAGRQWSSVGMGGRPHPSI